MAIKNSKIKFDSLFKINEETQEQYQRLSSNDKVATGFSSSKIKVNIIASFRPFKARRLAEMYSGFFVIVCSTLFV